MALNDKIKIDIRTKPTPSTVSRSRSPLPHVHLFSLASYRERSPDTLQESEIERQNNTLNTLTSNEKGLDQSSEDQNARGRSRDRTSIPVVEELCDNDEMISLMGFGGFGTTKGKHVKSTKGGGAKSDTKPEYRQYMNRTKGFNRPLSPKRK
ncbi:uncharacterized protein PRCAT00004687001 [Priceomyces carsonii]|uniref:uncharacterized protein n=1 Tax=Priceomyces carsonii TaxID=28549 RepID=UPI002EDABB98|nr:unnamed protein product [Priceomyces carsonii]